MRSLLRALSLALAFALVGAACGEDSDTTPIGEVGPGDGTEVTDAGAEGAFGEADDCSELIGQAVAAYDRVVDELGDADRRDIDRIDAAMESFGGLGPDLQVRYDALDCQASDFEAEVCAAAAGLEAEGQAAQDFIDTVTAGCAAA